MRNINVVNATAISDKNIYLILKKNRQMIVLNRVIVNLIESLRSSIPVNWRYLDKIKFRGLDDENFDFWSFTSSIMHRIVRALALSKKSTATLYAT